MICQLCGGEHDGNFGSGRFCSRKCSNSRVITDEVKEKISKGVKQHIKENGFNGPTDLSKLQGAAEAYRNKQLEYLMNCDFNTLKFERMRKRIILEQNNTCNHCKLDTWAGHQIPLEIDHVDGDHTNNLRDNLEALCPNCHALTDTWRGRNKIKEKRFKVTDDMLVESYIKTGNIRKCLLDVGLAPKGDNYGRVKRCLTLRNIPYK